MYGWDVAVFLFAPRFRSMLSRWKRGGNREEMFPNCDCDFFMKIFATEYFVRSTRVLSQ